MQLSIVVPVYKSEKILPSLAKEIESNLKFLNEFELILVNDNSPDASWNVIKELKEEFPFIRGINLMKNYTQHNAIMAGLNLAKGEVVITIDDDLQHSPTDIKKIYDVIQSGESDVCYTEFENKQHKTWKNIGSKFNNFVASYLLKKPKNLYLSPFRGMSRKIRNLLIDYDGPYPYVDGLILSVTQNIKTIKVTHHNRAEGEGNYTFFSSMALWAKMATGFSILPLRFATYFGILVSISSFIFLLLLIIQKLTLNLMPDGWSTITVLILFFGGFQLITIGIIGEYIGRIYLNVNHKAQYLVRDII